MNIAGRLWHGAQHCYQVHTSHLILVVADPLDDPIPTLQVGKLRLRTVKPPEGNVASRWGDMD